MFARRLAVVAVSAVALTGGAGVALAATHPIVTDPAGDARTALGANQPQADLLTADISSDGTNIVITQSLASLQAPNATTSSTYQVHFSLPGRRLVSEVSAANVNKSAATANLYDDPVTGPDGLFIVGTVTTNLGTGTVTARYPVADVPGLAAGTLLRNVTANTALTGTFLGLKDARDTATGGDYVFGQ